MGANSTSGNSGKCINSNINAEKTEKSSPLAEMDIQQHSPAKVLKTAKTEDVQTVQQTSSNGILFKIKTGKPSDIMKNTLGSGSNVKDCSLVDRV